LQPAPAGIAVGKGVAHAVEHIFVLAQRFTDHQRGGLLQRLADLLPAGDFADPGMTGVIFNDHDIAGEERRVRPAQVHQHAVVTGNGNNLHRCHNGRGTVSTHNGVLLLF